MVFPAIAAAFLSFTPEMTACLNAARGVSVVYPVVSSLVGRYLGHRGKENEREKDETQRRRQHGEDKKERLKRESLERYLERRQKKDTRANKQGGGDETRQHRLLQRDDKADDANPPPARAQLVLAGSDPDLLLAPETRFGLNTRNLFSAEHVRALTRQPIEHTAGRQETFLPRLEEDFSSSEGSNAPSPQPAHAKPPSGEGGSAPSPQPARSDLVPFGGHSPAGRTAPTFGQYAHTRQGGVTDAPPVPTWGAVVHRSFTNERWVTDSRVVGADEEGQAKLVRPDYYHHRRHHQHGPTPTSPPEGDGLLAQEPSPPWAAASAVLTATCVAVLLAKFIRRRRPRPRPLRPPRLGRGRGWAALRKSKQLQSPPAAAAGTAAAESESAPVAGLAGQQVEAASGVDSPPPQEEKDTVDVDWQMEDLFTFDRIVLFLPWCVGQVCWLPPSAFSPEALTLGDGDRGGDNPLVSASGSQDDGAEEPLAVVPRRPLNRLWIVLNVPQLVLLWYVRRVCRLTPAPPSPQDSAPGNGDAGDDPSSIIVPRFRGMTNDSMNCFLLAALQVLRKMPEFHRNLLRFPNTDGNTPTEGKEVTWAVSKTFKALQAEGAKGPLDPKIMVSAFFTAFEDFYERDEPEDMGLALNSILNKIDDETLNPETGTSIVESTKGALKTERQCQRCKETSAEITPFFVFQLDLPDSEEPCHGWTIPALITHMGRVKNDVNSPCEQCQDDIIGEEMRKTGRTRKEVKRDFKFPAGMWRTTTETVVQVPRELCMNVMRVGHCPGNWEACSRVRVELHEAFDKKIFGEYASGVAQRAAIGSHFPTELGHWTASHYIGEGRWVELDDGKAYELPELTAERGRNTTVVLYTTR